MSHSDIDSCIFLMNFAGETNINIFQIYPRNIKADSLFGPVTQRTRGIQFLCRKLQIFHFANKRFSISQTKDFPFRKLLISYLVSQTTLSLHTLINVKAQLLHSLSGMTISYGFVSIATRILESELTTQIFYCRLFISDFYNSNFQIKHEIKAW